MLNVTDNIIIKLPVTTTVKLQCHVLLLML